MKKQEESRKVSSQLGGWLAFIKTETSQVEQSWGGNGHMNMVLLGSGVHFYRQ